MENITSRKYRTEKECIKKDIRLKDEENYLIKIRDD